MPVFKYKIKAIEKKMARDDVVERILDVCDIVDVIGEAVQLRPRGSNHIGLCPFHNEKTPSFTVSSSKGIYTCFGCGKKGNVFSFMKDFYGMEFGEAVKELAGRYGIAIPEYKASKKQKEQLTKKEFASKAIEYAANYYSRLLGTTAGQTAMNYINKRNFTKQTVAEFKIGFSPSGWDELMNDMISKGYPVDSLIDAGLLVESGKEKGKYYDRFRERLIFAIHDSLGKIIGFGARQLNDDKTQPKYINSPQTILYDKSRVLYGLYQGKNDIRRNDFVIMTEGYADVISLHQAGFKNAVASSGTSLTIEQLRLLNKFTKKIYIVYDADDAGISAAVRAIDMALAEGFDINLVSLPEGEDPDSIVTKYGNLVFQEYLNNAETFVDFRIGQLRKENKLRTPAEISNAIREITKSIVRIPDRLQHDQYISRLASLLKLSHREVEGIYQEKGRIERVSAAKPARIVEPKPSRAEEVKEKEPESNGFAPDYQQLLPEELLILKYLISRKEVAEFLMDNLAVIPDNMFTGEAKRLLMLFIDLYSRNQDIVKHLVTNEEVHPLDKDFLISLAIDHNQISKEWKTYAKGSRLSSFDSHRAVRDALTRIEKIKIEAELNRLQELIRITDESNMSELRKQYKEMSRKLQKVKDILSNETAN